MKCSMNSCSGCSPRACRCTCAQLLCARSTCTNCRLTAPPSSATDTDETRGCLIHTVRHAHDCRFLLEAVPRRVLLHVPDDHLLTAGTHDPANAPTIKHNRLRPGAIKAMFAQVGSGHPYACMIVNSCRHPLLQRCTDLCIWLYVPYAVLHEYMMLPHPPAVPYAHTTHQP